MELPKTLSELPGAPGREERVRDFIHTQVKKHADEIRVDALGNLICIKRGKSKKPRKVMVACHMDEIAFYVRHIDENGFLRVQPLGGFDTRNLFARRVRIQPRKGDDIFGNLNPGGRPIHIATPEERSKIPTAGEFFVDTGLPVEKVREIVKVGDPVTLVQECIELGDHVTGKCMDNRVACWVGVKLLQNLKKAKDDVYVVFTVQEEIGVRGAITSSYDIAPDIGVAIDTTLAVDTPGVSEHEWITKLGGGTAIKIMDGYSVSDNALVDEFIAVAEKHSIPHQMEILPMGGTDAGALQRARSGARVVTLSVPTRYIHTVTETVHKSDLQATVDLLQKFLES
ncbi:MAG: M42 family metallopeptidase [bacterium]